MFVREQGCLAALTACNATSMGLAVGFCQLPPWQKQTGFGLELAGAVLHQDSLAASTRLGNAPSFGKFGYLCLWNIEAERSAGILRS